MLAFLFRNNAHHSETYLTMMQSTDCANYSLKKSAASATSIQQIKNELEGLKFYLSKIGRNADLLSVYESSEYYSFQVKYIEGHKADFKDGFMLNHQYIKRAIAAYCKIWKEANPIFIHGDFSIDNLIFRDDEVYVLDWEHYSCLNIPVGFDGLNLIFEQIYIDIYYKRRDISEIIIDAKNLIYKMQSEFCLDEIYFESPLLSMKKVINDNSYIWGEQLQKLPVYKFSSNDIRLIDQNLKLN